MLSRPSQLLDKAPLSSSDPRPGDCPQSPKGSPVWTSLMKSHTWSGERHRAPSQGFWPQTKAKATHRE